MELTCRDGSDRRQRNIQIGGYIMSHGNECHGANMNRDTG